MSEQQTATKKPRTPGEWTTLGIAGLILATVIGVVIWLLFTGSSEPARFTIQRDATRIEGQYFYLPITVINDGDETASQVQLVGTLIVNDQEETADTTFDFVPGHSQAEAVLIFSADPGAADVRVMSYQIP